MRLRLDQRYVARGAAARYLPRAATQLEGWCVSGDPNAVYVTSSFNGVSHAAPRSPSPDQSRMVMGGRGSLGLNRSQSEGTYVWTLYTTRRATAHVA